MSDLPTELPSELPEDSTPALPSEPSPISDAALPAVADQLRPIFNEVVKAAVQEAIAAVPTPTVRPGTVTTIDLATRSATVTLDEGTEETGTTVAQIVSEMPNVNDRVMVLFVPPHASFIIGIVGGSGLPAGSLIAYLGDITSDAGGTTGGAPPRGYLWAHGQDYASAQYPSLWQAIGTRYGTGSATGSGRVPDMRGRIPIGLDNMGGSDAGRHSLANVVGTTGGAESHSLTTSNLPNHVHSLGGHTHSFSGSLSGASVGGSVSVSGSTGYVSNDHVHSLPGDVGTFVAYGQNTPENGNAINSAGRTTYGQSANHYHSFSASGSISGGYVSGGSVSGTTGGANGNTGSAGSGSSVNHLPPVMVVHWLVKA